MIRTDVSQKEYEDSVGEWMLRSIQPGDVLGLREIHERLIERGWTLGKATTRRRLYKAVRLELLNRSWGWTGQRPGWTFALPETMPSLFSPSEWAGQDNPEEVL